MMLALAVLTGVPATGKTATAVDVSFFSYNYKKCGRVTKNSGGGLPTYLLL
jgi:broad-specificity NMP kinase